MARADDKLTIILPLKGRELFTLRWLSWARSQRWKFPIIIADGSESPFCQEYLRSFDDLSISYVRYPYDATLTLFLEKLVDAYSRVETPYVVLAPNDDFLLKRGMEKCVDFLEGHENHVAAAGDQRTFLVQPSRTSPELMPLYGDFEATPHTNYPGKSLEQETSTKRLGEYVRNHFNSFLWSAVHRTTPTLETWRTLSKAGLRDLRFVCHAYYLMSVAKGRIGHVPILSGLLQTNPGNSEGNNIVSRHPGWWDWFRTEHWGRDFKTFVDVVAEAVLCAEGGSKSEMSEHVARLYLERLGINLFQHTWPDEFNQLLQRVPQNAASEQQSIREVEAFLEKVESGFVEQAVSQHMKPGGRVPGRGKNRLVSALSVLRSRLVSRRTP